MLDKPTMIQAFVGFIKEEGWITLYNKTDLTSMCTRYAKSNNSSIIAVTVIPAKTKTK